MTKYIKVKLDFNGSTDLCKYEESFQFKEKDYYLVETRYGHDLGRILADAIGIKELEKGIPEYSILRPAEEKDFKNQAECSEKAKEAYTLTKSKIHSHKLPMKLIDIHFFLDKNKILFNFTAEGRVDFRDLVKDLASTYRTRIELRQVGVRDESALLGGHGVCGRAFCCTKQKPNHDPISIKMAKEQNLTLNSVKISGVCGRLMCCLDFESDHSSDGKSPKKKGCNGCQCKNGSGEKSKSLAETS